MFSSSPSPSHAWRIASAAVLLFAAGCSGTDAPTEPLAAAQAGIRESTAGAPGQLRRAGAKYRDTSRPHATGRSGTARLAARAHLDAQGIVRLLVTTGDVDRPAAAPGTLARVQLKVFDPAGRQLAVLNVTPPPAGSAWFSLPGLMPGSRIQVQALVRGIDGRRTDVVTVTETVKRAPSLAVALSAPTNATVGMPAVFTATVTETGGDAGTFTTCTLYVDGYPVDRADAVWVDAGDAVTCAFVHTFRAPGESSISVALGEMNAIAAAPSASATVSVGPADAPSWRAEVEDRTHSVTERLDYRWWRPDGGFREYESGYTRAARTQTVQLSASRGGAAAFPLARLEVSVEADGLVWQSDAWTALQAVADADGRLCVSRAMPEHGAQIHLCSNTRDGGATTVGFTRFAGTVTYHSWGYVRQWDGIAADETYWTWNDAYTEHGGGGHQRSLGPEVVLRVRVVDAARETVLEPRVEIRGFSDEPVVQPYTCRVEYPYWVEGGELRMCEGREERVYGRRGAAASG